MKRTASQASSIMIPKKGKINMTKTSVKNKGLGWRTKDTQTKDTHKQKTHKQKEKRSKTKKKRGEKRREKTKKKKNTERKQRRKPDHIGEG